MIRLHRLSARAEVFYLNPDLILSIDSTPDTVLTLTTHQKMLISDTPESVVAAIHAWRASILATAMPSTRRRSDAALTLVSATAGTPPSPDLEESDR